jgi:type I restriction-modification system DNA methylase subunit
MIEQELEARDYYTEKNVFWVPALARWDFIKANAKVAAGTKLDVKNGKVWQYEFKGIGRLLDDALDAVEKENPRLKNVLDKDYARKRVDEALPGQLFTNTQIPACIWFLTRNKGERGSANSGSRMRQGETLFIDDRNLGYMKDRVLRDFKAEDIAKVADTFHAWKRGSPSPHGGEGRGEGADYADIPCFCKAATLEEIRKHEYVPAATLGPPRRKKTASPSRKRWPALPPPWASSSPRAPGWKRKSARTWRGLAMKSEPRTCATVCCTTSRP